MQNVVIQRVIERIKIDDFYAFLYIRLPKGLDAYTVTGNIPFHEVEFLKLNCDMAIYYLHWLPILKYEEVIDFNAKWFRNSGLSKRTIMLLQ
jgi:hypothetical protein